MSISRKRKRPLGLRATARRKRAKEEGVEQGRLPVPEELQQQILSLVAGGEASLRGVSHAFERSVHDVEYFRCPKLTQEWRLCYDARAPDILRPPVRLDCREQCLANCALWLPRAAERLLAEDDKALHLGSLKKVRAVSVVDIGGVTTTATLDLGDNALIDLLVLWIYAPPLLILPELSPETLLDGPVLGIRRDDNTESGLTAFTATGDVPYEDACSVVADQMRRGDLSHRISRPPGYAYRIDPDEEDVIEVRLNALRRSLGGDPAVVVALMLLHLACGLSYMSSLQRFVSPDGKTKGEVKIDPNGTMQVDLALDRTGGPQMFCTLIIAQRNSRRWSMEFETPNSDHSDILVFDDVSMPSVERFRELVFYLTDMRVTDVDFEAVSIFGNGLHQIA